MDRLKILVTGATGYVGGRLVPRLLERGHNVRVFVRDVRRIEGRSWANRVEVVQGDLLNPDSLRVALDGVEAAYYLVHSMGEGSDFAAQDRLAAITYGSIAATLPTLRLTIYLGGLLPKAKHVSEHLRSRAEVGALLRDYVPTTEFQAGPIIGSGSASFEMVRYLTERLPVMVAPRWILNDVQPIAIRDVLSYLIAALDSDALGAVEVGADRLTFKQMMLDYAEARGLHRIIIPVPVLAPGLAARWVGLVTPIPNTLAVPLVRGVVHPVVADTRSALAEFPSIHPISYRQSVDLALGKILNGDVETRWSGSLGATSTYDTTYVEGLVSEVRTIYTELPAESIFRSVSSIGGDRGWLAWEPLWTLRGIVDKLVGGPGLRRGRRDPTELLPGEALDFWRVEAVNHPTYLRLRAEMKVPGRAWLQWEVVPEGRGSRVIQTALFAPHGLFGILYWYALFPVHKFIFSAMLRAIVRDAALPQFASVPASSAEVS
jgi:uncharacterized protein YbjT (DUF2867 family)